MASVIQLGIVTVLASVVISAVIGMVDELLVEEIVLVLVLSGSIGAFVIVVGVVEELIGVVEEDVSGGHFGKFSIRIGLLLSMLFSPHPHVWINMVAVEVVTFTFVIVITVVVTVFNTVLVALIIELHISMNGRKMENMDSSRIGRSIGVSSSDDK